MQVCVIGIIDHHKMLKRYTSAVQSIDSSLSKSVSHQHQTAVETVQPRVPSRATTNLDGEDGGGERRGEEGRGGWLEGSFILLTASV